MKTKIYQTIKGLNVLFIKLEFPNQMQQAFKPLHALNSNLNLYFSLNSNSFINASSSIFLYYLQYTSFMILDLVYTSRSLYLSNQVRSRLTYPLGLGATSLHTRSLLSS